MDYCQQKSSETISHKEFERRLLEYIILTNQPFIGVEEDSFRLLLRGGYPKFEIPSQFTIKRRIEQLFAEERNEVKAKIQSAPGKISFILDAWKSSTQYTFHGIVAQFINHDWELQSFVLELDIFKGSHTGQNLARSFLRTMEDFNICKKIVAVTTDNASNYEDTFFDTLSRDLIDKGVYIDKLNQKVRCLAHIINLACQEALIHLKVDFLEENTDLDENDDESPTKEPVREAVENDSIFSRLRKSIVKIRKSPRLLEVMKLQCEIAKVKPRDLVKDNKTRWNSTYYMLNRAFKLKVPLEATLRGEKNCLRFMLTDSEWKIVEDIVIFLKPFKIMTLYLSHQKIPTMSMSAMIYVHLYNHLEKCTVTNGFSSVIQAAAKSACEKLNKYYPSSDAAVYIIGTILDPRCKLEWYASVEFHAKTIKSYKRVVTKYWEETYKPHNPSSGSTAEHSIAKPHSKKSNPDLLFELQMRKSKNNFDELTVYLSQPAVPSDSSSVKNGSLGWWKDNEKTFPNLSKMARDYLAVSGTGVPIESFFSGGPDLLTSKRKAMSAQTTRMCMCLKAWLRSKNQALFSQQIMEYIRDKIFGS